MFGCRRDCMFTCVMTNNDAGVFPETLDIIPQTVYNKIVIVEC